MEEGNPIYGTAKVLQCYQELGRTDCDEFRRGVNWLTDSQNADGGWGGGDSIRWPAENLGRSSVEETALAVEVLADCVDNGEIRTSFEGGLQWLIYAVENGHYTKPSPIGFYFAKLWYYERLYPVIFAGSALAAATRQ